VTVQDKVDVGRAGLVREMLSRSAGMLTERIDALEQTALQLLVAGPLAPEVVADAVRTAHQLVSLGVFGLDRGAELAKRAEELLRAPGEPGEQGAALADLVESLRAEVATALTGPPVQRTAPLAETIPTSATSAPDVLVVEEDRVLVGLLTRALEAQGYTVAAVSDGAAAVAALDVPAEQRARLVLLDVDLPALDGFGVLRALSARGLLPGVPVLVLTARASEPEVLSVLSLGAVDHVAKPFSLPVLLARVARASGRVS
jgi:CheY-like chemotaxis protein